MPLICGSGAAPRFAAALSYYEVPGKAADCQKRLLMASVDATLRAVDADTGAACESFGEHGVTDLLTGLGTVKPGFYTPTSPPAIVRGLVVVGSGVPDNGELENPSGVGTCLRRRNGKVRVGVGPRTPGSEGGAGGR